MTQEEIMKSDGYVLATDAAKAVGIEHISTMHAAIKSGRTLGLFLNGRYYVSVAGLLKDYAAAKVIVERIKALGVAPNAAHTTPDPRDKAKTRPAERGASGRTTAPPKRRKGARA